MEIASLISDLETCGWFADLTAPEAESLRSDLAEGSTGALHLKLASFVISDPDRFGVGSLFEVKSGVASYEDLFKAYATASGGNFAPEAIVEEADDDGLCFTIGFLAKGRIHALFTPGAPCFDLEINDIVNDCLADSLSKKRFFILPTSDESIAFAYVSPSVFERACKLGIIPLQEDFLGEFSEDSLGAAESARPTSYALRGNFDLVSA